jgi:hypothetical protein
MKAPMTKARLEEIRKHDAGWADPVAADPYSAVAHRRELLAVVDAAVAEVNRVREAYDELAMCIGRLDFDRSESAVPETQEQWIEFVRELDDRAQKLIDADDEARGEEPEASAA